MEVSGPEDDPFLSQFHQVQCPVCQQMMPATHINSHLDRCLLLHPAGQAESAAGSHSAGEPAKGPSPPLAKRRRHSESSAPKQPATPTAAESSEGEGEEGDDGETESRESYDAPPTPSGARLIPDFPVARVSSPGRKGSGKRPAASAAAARSASPRSWDEAEAQEEEEVVGDGDVDGDGEEDQGSWDAEAVDAAATAAFGGSGGGRSHSLAMTTEEIRQMLAGKPLADKMRPGTLQDYIGQSRAVGQETLLRSLLETNEIPSLILWGPPGCGKTTLAHIIANNSKKHSIRFVTLSATNAKTNDVRDVIKQAQNEKNFFKRKTILFIDEIHRFNKSQQVNAALLSRCRVIVLEKLPVEAMVTILMRAINSLGIHILDSSRPTDPLSHSSNTTSEPPVLIEDKAVDTLAYLSDGDARTGLNGLQLAVLARLNSKKMFGKKGGQSYSPSRVLITENDVKEGLQRSHILYDRAGEEHYNCISALHKSMRGSDQNASLYWLARMLEGGEDPLYVARRLVRFASEDIGLADPSALTQAVAAYQGCHFIGMPECEVLLAQCVVYFARAPKSIEVYSAYNNVKACLRNHQGPLPPVPLHLRNAPTRLMKDLGYGKGYKYNPMYSEPVDQEYLPEELRGADFFKQRRC
ncbi:PREDICTED: ATPase WRNIP1 isoform X2 [Elephantulus edwardii]|uniref:ATPase WRNIP1 isoform X2 n=1 Tax=Elephantulus edwardii TaxID=28737 RepID=UPI0003F0ABA2|nr:PREDICTED: ATPase WRNIP1 isoform X2 [Elephantulus edwardii]